MTITKTKASVIIACSLALAAVPCSFAGNKGDHSPEAMFKSMDTDGDGRVSRTEHAAMASQMFGKMDANSDGIVTAAEMTACREKEGYKSTKDELSSAEKIKMIDTNADGQLTKAEHDTGTESMFTKMDTDGDGYLSSAECAAGHDKMLKKQKS